MSLKHVAAATFVALAVGASGANAQVDNAREAQRAYAASTQEFNEVTQEAQRYEDAARAIRDTAIEIDLSEGE